MRSCKIVKKIISIIMILIISITILFSILNTKSYAISQVRDKGANNINNIDTRLYPGYAERLQALRQSHPNWTFTLLYTDLDWTTVLNNEAITNHARSLVQGKSGEWLCNDVGCKGVPKDGSNWYHASQTAVAYYLDPRNFLTESAIFQFETLSYVPTVHTEAGVETLLKGTFMYNTKICDYYQNYNYTAETFAQVIMRAAVSSGISPYHIASRIKQEVGAKGSGASSGKVAGYEGYYNFYNIGSYASSDPVINGLMYAKEKGWNTPDKSIVAGAEWIGTSYIKKGQDTIYLQKFDVDNQYLGLYSHQYQQNIQVTVTESSTVYNSYKALFNGDLTNSSFNFVIPLYKNMPSTPARYPSNSTYVTQDAQIKGTAVAIRKSPGGELIGRYSNGYSFLRIELNCASASGSNWDKIMLSNGTIAYVASQYVIERTNSSLTNKVAYVSGTTNLLNAPLIATEGGAVVIRSLSYGQSVTILEQGVYGFYDIPWARIRLGDGTIGYVDSRALTVNTLGELVTINVTDDLGIRDNPNGNTISRVKGGAIVTRLEKASSKVGGYYWDKVVTAEGLTGYMARETYNPYKLWLVPVDTNEANNNQSEINNANRNMRILEETTLNSIRQTYSDATLVSGNENLGTGSIVKINGVDYKIVKLGDVNGDASVDVIDLALLKRHLMGTNILQNEYAKAGMIQSNSQNEIDIIDLALMKRHLMGTQYISL